MKITTLREAAVRREPRTFKTVRPMSASALPTSDQTRNAEQARNSEQAWPGFTRAQLRDHIIDQIG